MTPSPNPPRAEQARAQRIAVDYASAIDSCKNATEAAALYRDALQTYGPDGLEWRTVNGAILNRWSMSTLSKIKKKSVEEVSMSTQGEPAGELKACPWCGPIVEGITDATRILGDWRLIHRCKVIGAVSLASSQRERVVSTWNTRPLESALESRIASMAVWIAELERIAQANERIAALASVERDQLSDRVMKAEQERDALAKRVAELIERFYVENDGDERFLGFLTPEELAAAARARRGGDGKKA